MSERLSSKLRQLDDFLLSDAVSHDTMLLSELDGCIAGVVVCPELMMPSEWLPVVWGGEGPVFENERQAQTVLGLIMEHYNDVIRQLDRGEYGPFYDLDHDETVLWETWIEGFVAAMGLRPKAWLAWAQASEDVSQQAYVTLTRLGELATCPKDVKPLIVDATLKELAPELIPEAVETLHRSRIARAAAGPHPANENYHKVGRNDPCPCGSGKKFKNCCLYR